MKKYIFIISGLTALIVIGALAAGENVFAKNRGGGKNCWNSSGYDESRVCRIEFLREELGLDDAQTGKISAINSRYRSLLRQNRDNQSEREGLIDKRHEEIKSVLNEEQKIKFDALKNDSRLETRCGRR